MERTQTQLGQERMAWLTSTLLAACLGAGCAGDTSAGRDEDAVGSAVVSLTEIPSDVACVRIDVGGATRSEHRNFDVMPGASSAELRMDRLPVGQVSVDVTAFDGACASVTDLSVPGWISDTLAATIARGQVARLAVSMRRNGRSTLSVDFPADEVASGGSSTCPDAAPAVAFRDDFDGTALGDAWSVWQYTGTRHNGLSTPANHFTVSDGALHYNLDPMSQQAANIDYAPAYDGAYYWYDPGLEVSRPLAGESWTLELGINWYLPLVVNAAGFAASIQFGEPGSTAFTCMIYRYSNDDRGLGVPSDNNLLIAACGDQSWQVRAPLETNIARQVRFQRAGDIITISLSSDGTAWETLVVSDPLPDELRCAEQTFQISGTSWFNPNGSRADYDYVSFEVE